MERQSWDEYFMDLAQHVATRATCDRKHVGAVLVRDRRIISTGYNGSIPGQPHCSDPETFWVCTNCGTQHLTEPEHIPGLGPVCRKDLTCYGKRVLGPLHGGHDMVDGHCIRTIHAEVNTISQAALVGTPTQGATLYCNTFPCYACFKTIIAAGIGEMVYLDEYKVTSGDRVLSNAHDLASRGFQLRRFIPRG
jgi:dCMP deaminase